MATQKPARGANSKLAGQPVLPKKLVNKVRSTNQAGKVERGQEISNNRTAYINLSVKALRDQRQPAASPPGAAPGRRDGRLSDLQLCGDRSHGLQGLGFRRSNSPTQP